MGRHENLNVTKLNGGQPLFILDSGNVTLTATTVVATVFPVLRIPQGTTVINQYTSLVTSSNATCTAEIGDGSDANGWDASADFNVATGAIYTGVVGTDAYAGGKTYSVEDYIDAKTTFSSASDTCAVRMRALCARL